MIIKTVFYIVVVFIFVGCSTNKLIELPKQSIKAQAIRPSQSTAVKKQTITLVWDQFGIDYPMANTYIEAREDINAKWKIVAVLPFQLGTNRSYVVDCTNMATFFRIGNW